MLVMVVHIPARLESFPESATNCYASVNALSLLPGLTPTPVFSTKSCRFRRKKLPFPPPKPKHKTPSNHDAPNGLALASVDRRFGECSCRTWSCCPYSPRSRCPCCTCCSCTAALYLVVLVALEVSIESPSVELRVFGPAFT